MQKSNRVRTYTRKGRTVRSYSRIELRPPKSVQKAASKALEVRRTKPPSQRGMTPVGIARARDLSAGKSLSPNTVRRMKSYFDRHEVDKKGKDWDKWSRGKQSWMGWGSDDGRAWANRKVQQLDKAQMSHYPALTALFERSQVRSYTRKGKQVKTYTRSTYTKPKLREALKQKIQSASIGGKPGQWSGRKSQLLAQEYRKSGGGYRNKKLTKQAQSLNQWTKQDWGYSSPKQEGKGRYLPRKVWQDLTPGQKAAANRTKQQGTERGKQFVSNSAAAKKKMSSS